MLFALSHSTEADVKTLMYEHRLFGRLMEEYVKGRVYKTHANDKMSSERFVLDLYPQTSGIMRLQNS